MPCLFHVQSRFNAALFSIYATHHISHEISLPSWCIWLFIYFAFDPKFLVQFLVKLLRFNWNVVSWFPRCYAECSAFRAKVTSFLLLTNHSHTIFKQILVELTNYGFVQGSIYFWNVIQLKNQSIVYDIWSDNKSLLAIATKWIIPPKWISQCLHFVENCVFVWRLKCKIETMT